MKFLVLALCVCAASAATFNPYNNVRAFATASVSKPVYNAQVVPEVVPVVPVVPARAVPVAQLKTVVNTDDVHAEVLRSSSDVHPEGFAYNFETSNGIAANAEGTVKNVNNAATLNVQGQYRYIDANGTPVQVTYVANENGFQPDSSILPQPHPIPEAILRSLQYIAAHPQKEEVFAKKF